MKFSLFSILLATTSSVIAQRDLIVVGGDDAKTADYPYFVNWIGCGGTLIAPDIVLTAAHCKNLKDQQVAIGAYKRGSLEGGAQERYCEKWIVNPEFKSLRNYYYSINKDYNDFALCKLNKPVVIDESKIRLELNEDDSVPSDGEDLQVMGMGNINEEGEEPEFLQDVTVPVVNSEICDGIYEDITANKLCAGYLDTGGKDSCQGDSGGPIVKRTVMEDGSIVDIHVGITSNGFGCAQPGYPGVYARTSSAIDWIKETSCNNLQSVASFCNNPVPPPPPPRDCNGVELIVAVTTDDAGYHTSWELYGSKKKLIMSRKYALDNYKNEHKLCLDYDIEYLWIIRDWAGDGMFDATSFKKGIPWELGIYSLNLDGKDIFAENGLDAWHEKNFTFVTPPAPLESSIAALVSPSPTAAPIKRNKRAKASHRKANKAARRNKVSDNEE